MTPIPYDALGEEGPAVAQKDAVGQSRGPIELGCQGCQATLSNQVVKLTLVEKWSPPTAPACHARTTLDPSGRPGLPTSERKKEESNLPYSLIVTF